MSVSISQVKGPRPYQEDFYFTSERVLAVLDGHGGDGCAVYCANRLAELVPTFAWTDPVSDIASLTAALADECHNTESGAAFSIVHVGDSRATVGILGDSPVIVIDADGNVNVSPEHNVRSNGHEAAEARARGGVIYNGYVCNSSGAGLQMSRALGDRRMGKIISNIPEIYQVPINRESAILVATDGVVDPAHTDAEAQNTIAKLLRNGADATKIIEAIPDLRDNATAIVWKAE